MDVPAGDGVERYVVGELLEPVEVAIREAERVTLHELPRRILRLRVYPPGKQAQAAEKVMN